MFESFSASGSRVHNPLGPRKSGMPDSVEMPAPDKTTTRFADSSQPRTVSMLTVMAEFYPPRGCLLEVEVAHAEQPQQPDDDEVERDDEIEQARHDQNQDACDERHERANTERDVHCA